MKKLAVTVTTLLVVMGLSVPAAWAFGPDGHNGNRRGYGYNGGFQPVPHRYVDRGHRGSYPAHVYYAPARAVRPVVYVPGPPVPCLSVNVPGMSLIIR